MNGTIAGVLTGDIVKSRDIETSDYDKLLYTLDRTFKALAEESDLKFDIYRGDSFQAIFSEPSEALKAAIIIRLALRTSTPPFDARQSIGIGKISSLRQDVRSSIGEAFTLSGTGLDEIKGKNISIRTNNNELQERLELVTSFVDAHISSLPPAQSEVLMHYLISRDKSHNAIALASGKGRSNVTRLLNACRYQLVDEYLSYCKRYTVDRGV